MNNGHYANTVDTTYNYDTYAHFTQYTQHPIVNT